MPRQHIVAFLIALGLTLASFVVVRTALASMPGPIPMAPIRA